MRTTIIAMAAAACIGAPALPAQESATALIEGARAQVEGLNGDSAYALLVAAFQLRPSGNNRVRAFTMLGFAELLRANRQAARNAFEEALRLDRSLRIDSIADLHSEAPVVFAELRQIYAPPVTVAAGLSVELTLSRDTNIAAQNGRLRIGATPSHGARVAVVVTPADAPTVVIWADTELVRGVGALGWDLRGRDGNPVEPGRYAVRVSATDSVGVVSPLVQRVVLVERVVSDTQAIPEPLLPSAFAPETLHLRRGSPAGLAAGLVLGAAAAFLPSALGNAALSGNTATSGAYAIGGVVSIAGIAAWMTGQRARPMPENAARNAQLRLQHANAVRTAEQANAATRAAAPFRVRLEESP